MKFIDFLIFLLFAIIITYSFIPRYISNIFGILNSTKNEDKLDVVIAHYKENLDWVDKYLPKNCRIFIYTKSKNIPNCKRKYYHKILKNVGRCDHTYLYHIISNYKSKNFSKNILFTPGSCDLFYKKVNLNILLHNIGKSNFNSNFLTNNILLNFCNSIGLNDFAKRRNYCSSYDQNKHKICDLKMNKFTDYNKFKKYFKFSGVQLSLIGIFAIRSKIIYNRSKKFYTKLIKILNYDDNILEGHFVERSWYDIFLHN
jgi:hypothetical protein